MRGEEKKFNARQSSDLNHDDHYIVAIGASAGGLEAIHEFFDYMPENKNLSFVIIQHLSPDYRSLLVELVSRHTEMKVYEAENNLPIRKNCIYVIPNNKFITIRHNHLVLTEKLPQQFPNNAIDVFLQSLAKEKKSKAIAIILSGTGSDGTKGIKAIKDEGGLVIVQEPTSSKFDGMPNSAITSGNADFILPANEIPAQVMMYVVENHFDDANLVDDEMLNLIFKEIHKQDGFDFFYYKTPTIIRRILHRMQKSGYDSIDKYYAFLKDNAEESRQLGKEFLINVTRFFRDPEAFEALRSKGISALVKKKMAGSTLKVWVCACSTGEEAYSLAILIDEVIQQEGRGDINVKFFATDVDRANIEIASTGIYPKTIEEDISPERLQKYFTPCDEGYQINNNIRKQIVFAVHNVTKDPPFIKNDIVACRNMLIYMNNLLQQKVYSVLLFAANINGFLFLGPTENPNPIRACVDEVDVKWKIFVKKKDAKIAPILQDLSRKSSQPVSQTVSSNGKSKAQPTIWDEFKDTLFTDFNFAAFHIDHNFEIKDAVGNFNHILSLPKKVLKLNLLRMLPSSISTAVIGEIKSCWRTGEKKVIKNLHVMHNDQEIALQILIKPDIHNKPFTLVAFHFMPVGNTQSSVVHRSEHLDASRDEYILALEEELNEAKNNLQFATEDLETTNEELQSSNEELLSANEELQSSNEELQSLNEELHTLNTEHQIKIKELVELNDDLTNYFRSSNIGQIFLDSDLIIRKFNPASVRIINFIESDIGRPITHISTNIRYDGFINDIQSVLRTNNVIEKEVQLQSGMNLLLRIMPYITRDQEVAGVVISFFDITTITNLNNIIRGVFNSTLNAIFALRAVRDDKNQIIDFSLETTNHAGSRLLKQEIENLKGKGLKRDIKLKFLDDMFQQFVSVVERNKTVHVDIFYEADAQWFEVSAVKMMDGLVATYSDITQKKTSEERLKKNYVELITAKETLKKLNAELEAKIAERTRMLAASEERFRMVAHATNDVIWDWDIVNNQMWVSDAFQLKFGHTFQNVSRSFWNENIHTDDRQGIERSVQQALNTGKSQWNGEYKLVRTDGTYRDVLDRAYIMHDEFGTPYRMIGSILDITELKLAELEVANNIAQREFLAESMPLIVWTANVDGEVDFVNKQFEVYTGMNAAEALMDGWKKVIHPEDIDRLTGLWNDSLKFKSDFQVEVRVRLNDGNYHWNLLRAKVRKDMKGNAINWVVSTVDIHDQKQINEVLEQKIESRTMELRKMNYALEESNNDLQQFASVASHDLQEPLRKIHLYANMLQERYASALDGGATYLDKILVSSARMKSIISNILNYSKLSEENNVFEMTDLNAIINDILDDLEVSIQEKHARISVDVCPQIEAIPGQVRQVFQNIIGNALKFSKRDETPVITIHAERVFEKSLDSPADRNGKFCRIFIKDNGIGFDEKFAKNIFVLFQRLHSKDSYEGTGIGLAIAKKIIEKHNGLISAKGEEGKGATFIMVLPIRQNVV